MESSMQSENDERKNETETRRRMSNEEETEEDGLKSAQKSIHKQTRRNESIR